MTIPALRRVSIVERGWPGHFILGYRCLWRRNTLLVLDERRIVVSSVGRCMEKGFDQETFMEIGANRRMMETLVFVARYDEPYWEADVSRQLSGLLSGLEWFSKDSSRTATLAYETIHDNTVTYWQGEIASLADRDWDKLTAVEDK